MAQHSHAKKRPLIHGHTEEEMSRHQQLSGRSKKPKLEQQYEVGGSRETSRSGGSRETSRSGGSRETSRSGGSRETSCSGGSRETSRSGGSRETSRSGGSRETSRSSGSRETSRSGGSRETSRSGGSRETSCSGGSIETSRSGGSRETSRSDGSRETSRSGGTRETSRSSGSRETSGSGGSREASRSGGSRETSRSGGSRETSRNSGLRETSGSGGSRETSRSGGSRETSRSGGSREISRSGGSRETSRSGGSRETSRSGGTRETSRSGGKSFKMKRPTLLRQLQTILVKYPDDSQILREMVQNAEDAGASCMKIWNESRAIDPGGTSNIRHYFKGPGICVYNDAVFTDKDWEGIITIYNSIKEEDCLKVGRFGLGFKSVFHMTDNPVVISGDRLLIIDPRKSEKNEDECWSISLTELNERHSPRKTLTCIFNRFKFNESVLEKGEYNGTLFWFPLRQIPSTLCSTVYTNKKAKSLFNSFLKESSYNLLFLSNLEKIKIYKARDDMPKFTIEMYGIRKKEFNITRRKFRDDLAKLEKKLPTNTIKVQFEAVIRTNDAENHYAVVSCLTGTEAMSEGMRRLLNDKELSYSPFTSVAYCTKSDSTAKPGHVFCFLPLPIPHKSLTGLPVHVNGFFDLEDNRRHLNLADANNETEQSDKALMWNKGLIQEFLPDSYYALVQFLKEKSMKHANRFIDDVYRSIPDPDVVDLNWYPLIKTLYKKLLDGACFYTKQGDGKWINQYESLFSVFDEKIGDDIRNNIEAFLLDHGENLVMLPSHIVRVMNHINQSPDLISPKTIRDKLKRSQVWQAYRFERQLKILTFILQDRDYADLKMLKLLPLNNKTFTSFSMDVEELYVLGDEVDNLFPGMDTRLISKAKVSDVVWQHLATVAKRGLFQLRLLSNDALPDILKETLDINCIKMENGCLVPRPASALGIKWIKDVWDHIVSRKYINLDQFHNVSLIPVITTVKKKKTVIHQSRCTAEETRLEFLNLKGNYMLSNDTETPQGCSLEKIIKICGTRIISEHQTIKFPDLDIIGKYIKRHILANVLNCFKAASCSVRWLEIATSINEKCDKQEMSHLSDYLGLHYLNIPVDTHKLLQRLQMVKQSDNVHDEEMVSIKKNHLSLEACDFPKNLTYPRKFLLARHLPLVKRLGGSVISESECLSETLNLMLKPNTHYSLDDKRKMMIHLKDRPTLLGTVLHKAVEVKFVPATDGGICRVKDLYNPSSRFLREILHGEEGMFPDESFMKKYGLTNTDFMMKLGIKTKDNISEEIIRIARSIDQNHTSSDKIILKAKALVKYITQDPLNINNDILKRIQDYKWVPCHSRKSEGYPSNLCWFHDQMNNLYRPTDVKSLEFKSLVGSVVPLIAIGNNIEHVATCYGWFNPPTQELVIKHFECVIKAYTQKENTDFLYISKEIWKYIDDLRRAHVLDKTSIDKLSRLACIPTNNCGFKSIKEVVLELGSHNTVNLEPYIYELSSIVKDYCDTFIALGVKECANAEHLKAILRCLNSKHRQLTKTSVKPNQVRKDRKCAINILSFIVDLDIDVSDLTNVLVPIASNGDDQLIFKCIKQCIYAVGQNYNIVNKMNLSIDVNGDDNEDAVFYVHHDMIHLAAKLGVVSSKKHFMLNQNTTALPWGQRELMTLRISSLLKSYTDGLAVFKELIQNADDAGATKVCFLYDERDNLDCRDGLFDKGMVECQGQSLFVYNNAVFKDHDFKNLIKLGLNTKSSEKSKIGKFGLGFCSVYNLTDVPCILSNKTFVVLDPHFHHLGDFILEENPGIRVPLTENYIAEFPNQFKPYHNMFGCKLRDCTTKGYDGTLFRLPLRTRRQASKSEIKSLEYSKREMKELLKTFVDSAANLMLFTQNVLEISVYHLHPKSTNPDKEKQLLFRTSKSYYCPNDGSDQNYLNLVTTAMKSDVVSKLKLPKQIVDIDIKVDRRMQKLLPETKPVEYRSSWILSWGTGNQSYQLAKTLEHNGAVPIGTVAVPVKRDREEIVSFVGMSSLPEGFYKCGHIFCFLPLPLETDLSLHINGCFMVESDRKSIIRSNRGEDKSNESGNWNKAMLEDIIKSAYIDLLTFIACKSSERITQTDYWILWPNPRRHESHESASLFYSFYKHILNTNATVFYRKSSVGNKTFIVTSIDRCLFLCPKFRNSSENGQIAYKSMLALYKGEYILMDLPTQIYQNFKEADEQNINKLDGQIISKHRFFSQYFFPEVNNIYWQKPGMKEQRNKLVMEALEDENLHKLVEANNCIQVKNSDILRKPKDLVFEKGSVSALFTQSDGRFPIPAYGKYEHTLLNMEMMDDTMTSTLLIERANTLQYMRCEKAIKRSKEIMLYLHRSVEKHYDVVDKLKNIKFLPIMTKPSKWHLVWKGDRRSVHDVFSSPGNLFSSVDKCLIGSVGLVLDPVKIANKRRVLAAIGMQEVTSKHVFDQLLVLANTNISSSVGLEDMCGKLYTYIDRCLKVQPNNIHVNCNQFWTKRIIAIGKEMIEPSKVVLQLTGMCRPYLYQMPEEYTKYENLWRWVGIPETFKSIKIKAVLQEHIKTVGTTQMSPLTTKCIINVIQNLCDSLRLEGAEISEEERGSIFIPDRNCVMRSVNDICYNEKDFPYDDDDVYIVHGDITRQIIDDMAIVSKRCLFLLRNADALPFGQKEKLVTRLNGLLKDYPKDHSVLNELLQNADDAGATEIHFVYDLRQVHTNQFFDKKRKPLPSGPALCVYNNACFSQADIIGIQNLGEGSKLCDRTKTGQFGVGFNAVYHLTDIPSFITHGPEIPSGGTFCVFDPHCWHVPIATTDSPGMMMKLCKFESKYEDIYDRYLQDILPAETGTWFRFPLRTNDPECNSKISTNSIMKNDMIELLTKMKEQMRSSLLFLSRLKKISISYIQEDCEVLSDTYAISLQHEYLHNTTENSLDKFILLVKEESQLLKSNAKRLDEISTHEVQYTAKIVDNLGNSDTWLISQTFGFPNTCAIPNEILQSAADDEFGFLPRGGIAMQVPTVTDSDRHEIENRERQLDGKAFCFLPLPISTGLPCHINGHFAVHTNRNSIFWGTHKDDFRYIWNKLLLQEVVAHSYANCILYARDILPLLLTGCSCFKYLDVFLSYIPDYAKLESSMWTELALEVFRNICNRELQVFPVCPQYSDYILSVEMDLEIEMHLENDMQCGRKGKRRGSHLNWTSLTSEGHAFRSCFDDLISYYNNDSYCKSLSKETMYSDVSMVRTVLVELGMQLICTPPWIYKSMSDCFLTSHDESHTTDQAEHNKPRCIVIEKVSPDYLLDFLKSWNTKNIDKCCIDSVNIPIEQTVFKTSDRLLCILKFCMKQSNIQDIDLIEAPLVATNGNVLVTLSATTNLILSSFCTLLPGSSQHFIHRKFVHDLWQFKSLFKRFDLNTFLKLLGDTLDRNIYIQQGPMIWNKQQRQLPNKKWIISLWKYLDTTDVVIPEFGNWCLFPSLWYDREPTLVSSNLAYTVVDIKSFQTRLAEDISMNNILEKLSLPTVCHYNKNSKHLHTFVASRMNPDKLAKCLVYHKNYIVNHNLSTNECDRILHFFTNDISQSQWREMRLLRLFTTINDTICDLEGVDRVLVVDVTCTSHFVLDGLDEIAQAINFRLLKYNPYHQTIYESLNFHICNSQEDEHPLTEFYIAFIIQYFQHLPRSAHICHLEFIRDSILNVKCNRLIEKLRALHFIPQSGGTFNKACEFYSPHNTVFIHLCPESLLPPFPFNQTIWKEFMIIAGMKHNVCREKFIQFALQIEKNGLSEKSKSQSKELVRHLLSRTDLTDDVDFLSQINKIKFIMPFVVQDNFHTIYPQFNSKKLVPFIGSVREENFVLAWTTDNILPSYAVPAVPDKSVIQERLQIKIKPTTDNLRIHIGNVCGSLQNGKLKTESKFINDVMTGIYRYLRGILENEPNQLKHLLADILFVHIIERNLFLKATNVVLKEPQTIEIEPYLMLASEKYEEFFEIFRRLGATNKITLDHYLRVLSSVKAEAGDLQLHANELQQTEKAVRGMLTLLQNKSSQDEETMTIHICYLLSEEKTLHPSSDLIFNDKDDWKKRLKQHHEIKFLANIDHFKEAGLDVDECLSMLPDRCKLQKLSCVVEEELLTSENKVYWEVTNALEVFLKSNIFVHCMIRLIKSEQKIDNEVIDSITASLKSIKVVALQLVRTILVHKNVRIESRVEDKACYHLRAKNIFFITMSALDITKWIARYLHHIASVVYTLCEEKAQMKHIQAVISNHNSTAEEMSNLLDDLDVRPVDYTPVENSWAPSPGTPVPRECLKFLVQELVQFSSGDYAVFEVFDNLHDDVDDEQGKVAVYIYVKIVDCLSTDQYQFPLYKVDIGDGQTMDVRSLRLYVIVRPRSTDGGSTAGNHLETCLYTGEKRVYTEIDKAAIIQEIEEVLVDAWHISSDDFRRVYKRLLLRWHPDKNPNSKLCTEITKHIINFAKRLQSGNIDSTKIPSYRERYGNRYNRERYRRQWDDYVHRANNTSGNASQHGAYPTFDPEEFAEEVRRETRYASWNNWQDDNQPNPQPEMAKVWITQAKNDLTAAKLLMTVATSESYNWVCVTSHQAAEKALKAVQISIDSTKATKFHSLMTPIALNHPDLKQAAQELERRVGDYTRMRYPRPVFYPKTPSDLYSEDDARETIRLAGIIVTKATTLTLK